MSGDAVNSRKVIGEEIANIRVSKKCTIWLIAFGPYSKQSIESLVAHLKLGLELGNFDNVLENEQREPKER